MAEMRDPPYMPTAVCRRCMAPDPKLREISHGLYEAVCDRCWPDRRPDAIGGAETLRRIMDVERNKYKIT